MLLCAALCCFALLTLVIVAGCGSTMQDVSLGRAGVTRFHQEMDAGQFDQIYSEAAPAFRGATTHDDFIAFISGAHRKLGDTQDPTETGFNVYWTTSGTTSGTQVVLSYQTKFQKGTATETFTWRITDGKLALVGYQVNSNVFVTQ